MHRLSLLFLFSFHPLLFPNTQLKKRDNFVLSPSIYTTGVVKKSTCFLKTCKRATFL